MNLSKIERRNAKIERRLSPLGLMHPGSLGEQLNVYGKVG
jgi:hypothetical protein